MYNINIYIFDVFIPRYSTMTIRVYTMHLLFNYNDKIGRVSTKTTPTIYPKYFDNHIR